MNLVKDTMSDKLYSLFINWVHECKQNMDHDIDDHIAWNELIQYLIELEKGYKNNIE